MVYSRAESWDFVENNMYNTYKNTQISILDSHCPEPKQEGGKRNSCLCLPPFYYRKCMMQGGEGFTVYRQKSKLVFLGNVLISKGTLYL